jgi:hypothetical protein
MRVAAFNLAALKLAIRVVPRCETNLEQKLHERIKRMPPPSRVQNYAFL